MASYQSLTNSLYAPSSSFITTGGNLTITDTTASTNITTGALIVAGGTGIAGDTYIGGDLIVTGTVTSSGGGGGFSRLLYRGAGGTTYTNTTFTGTYSRIEVTVDELSCGSTGSFRVELSGDNGSTWASPFTLTSSHSSTGGTDGKFTIDRCEVASGTREIHSVWKDGTDTVGTSNVTSGIIDAMRLSNTGGAITGGTITIVAWG